MFYSCPVSSDSGATKNAKGRVQARGITGARKPTRNSPCISRFDLLGRETLIALPYDFLPFFPAIFPRGPNQYRYPRGGIVAIPPGGRKG